VLTRDERSASFMADAYARLSGKVGVCEGPSGGGATYMLPGLAEANASSVPLVCLTSDIARQDAGRGTLTELDQTRLFDPVTRSSTLPASARELVTAIRSAFRDATTGPLGAAHVVLPYDVQLDDVAAAEVAIDPCFNRAPADRPSPSPHDVRAAADQLVNATRPLLVAGAGVLRSEAWDEVTALADLLGMPVATSIGGKGSIAETHPYALGVVGSNGGLPFRHDLLRESDVILYVGTRQGSVTTEKWTLPSDGEKTLLQMDVEPTRIGHNYQTAVGLVADAKCGLAALGDEITDRLGGRPAARIAPDEVGRRRDAYMASIEEFTSDRAPIRPERFVAELSRLLPPRSVVCADPGTPCPYLSAYYRLPQAGRWFVSPRAHGALGYALPAVCGAHFARPDAARLVGVMGDGSFGISAGELETIARLDMPVTLIVLNNSSYGWVKAGQKRMAGGYFSVDFSRADHAAIATAFGVRGLRVEDPGQLATTLEDALSHDGPVLVDVIVQPLEESRAPVSKWVA
jgi:acetolactate synthase-1/2/3 large subunit